MNRHDKVFINGLAVFSVLISFGFVFYAMGILTGDQAAEWEKVFAYVTVGYGLGNVYILSAAWNTGGTWTSWAYRLIAICFFAVFLMDLWKRGVESDFEYVGALVVAGVLWFNWFAVKRVSQRTEEQGTDKRQPPTPGKGQKGRKNRNSGKRK